MNYFELFFTFFRIGLFTIGGGYAMIPLINQTFAGGGLIEIEQLTNIIAIAEMSPGPFAVNAAAFIGTSLHSVPGAIVAVLGLVAPSLIIITFVCLIFFQINKKHTVKAVLGGIRPVVWALIIFSTLLVAKSAFYTPNEEQLFGLSVNIIAIIVFLVAFACMRKFKKITPVAFVAIAGIFGAFFL